VQYARAGRASVELDARTRAFKGMPPLARVTAMDAAARDVLLASGFGGTTVMAPEPIAVSQFADARRPSVVVSDTSMYMPRVSTVEMPAAVSVSTVGMPTTAFGARTWMQPQPIVTAVEMAPPVVTSVVGSGWPQAAQMASSQFGSPAAGFAAAPVTSEAESGSAAGVCGTRLRASRPSLSLTTPIVTAVEIAPAVVTAVTQAASVTRTYAVPAPLVYTEPIAMVSQPFGTATVTPPVSPVHPLMPPVRFTFQKEWNDYGMYDTAPTLSDVHMPPPLEPPRMQEADKYEAQVEYHEHRVEELAGQPDSTAKLSEQLHELLEAQHAMRDELKQVQVQVSSNYHDLETFRYEMQVRGQQPGSPPPTYQEDHLLLSQPPAYEGQDLPHTEMAPPPSQTGFSEPPGPPGGGSTMGDKDVVKVKGRPEVPRNLDYSGSHAVLTGMGNRFGSAMPDRKKFCTCWQ